ncbi:MAG: hypothetical protein FJ246_04560 [Nitrospira sp.]|nr:hypothetical protein [Nitrospira sp.]
MATERTVPPWLYKLFAGRQYPYVRRLAKFANKDVKPGEDRPEPGAEAIKAMFWEVFPRCSIKILEEVKKGMIVGFTELGTYDAGTYQELVEHPEEFLSKMYGKKKIKVNFYDGENFVCTINFKVAGWTEHEEH